MGLATAQCEVPLNVVFFSTEEDFVTRGPVPSDGNPIISDGDLLNAAGYVYMRNLKLLSKFDGKFDLGLDAADVIDIEGGLVAFSTELDYPPGRFTAGDLLVTNGAILPNSALLASFEIARYMDLGLDAVHFIGEKEAIIKFLEIVKEEGHKYWLENPKALIEYLEKYGVDIWFSTEGTAQWPENPKFLDGDLLSAAKGIIVIPNSKLLPLSVPAGILKRGVDFGLDAVTLYKEKYVQFSTEILYEDELSFTDGDVLLQDDGVTIQNIELIKSFEPKVEELGLDALSFTITVVIECIDFESLTIGNVYNVGDTFTDSGVTITVLPFQWGNNLWTSGGFAKVVDNGCAGVSGKEINVNNVNLGFNFNGPLKGLSLNFGEYGGNLNIEINDVFQNFENFVDINTNNIGGVNVSVINGYGNDKGRLILSGEMGMFDFNGQDFMFVIGGQELCVDYVCPSF
jgi:hypothetical protein